MSTDGMINLLVGVSAVLGVLVAWLGYQYSRQKDKSTAHDDHVKALIAEALSPLDKSVTELRGSVRELHTRIDNAVIRQNQQADDIQGIDQHIGSILDRLAGMQTKIDVYWKTVENMAMDAAKIIHSPNPERAHIDALIDKYRDTISGSGSMSPDEISELKGILRKIVTWEPGGEGLGFPVYPGEQMAAVFLLHTMDMSLENKGGK